MSLVPTYKELKEKYPEVAEDITKLQEAKNKAIMALRIFYFGLGFLASYVYFVVL